MANIRYSVPCPSCEATVPIRSTAAIGKKTECPKCKYRFVVPEPADDEGDEAPAKGKKDAKKGKKAKSGSPMVLVGVIVGVLAVGALVFGAVMIFGDNDSPPTGNTVAGGPAPAPGGGPGTGPSDAGTAAIGAGGEVQPGAGEPGTTPGGPTPPPAPRGGLKDVTNLLPGDSVAVYRVNADRARSMATPLYTGFIDASVREMFRQSFTFSPDLVETYVHCVVNPDREPFAVIRTKAPFDQKEVYQTLSLEQPKNGRIKGRTFFLIKSNPFVDAAAKAFTTRALASLFGLKLPPEEPRPPSPAEEKKYALHVYDSQTLMISTELQMERFLTDLRDDGFPPFKSELTPTAPPAAPMDPNNPQGPMPPGPPSGRGGPPVGPGGASAPLLPRGPAPGRDPNIQTPPPAPPPPGGPREQGGPGAPGGPPMGFGPGAPGGPGTEPPAAPRRLYTSIPTYRTVEPALKKMLNQLEEDERNPPAAVYAEMIDQRILNARDLGQLYKENGNVLVGLLSQIKIVGFALHQLNKDLGSVTANLEYVSDDDAKKSVAEHIVPLLTLAKLLGDPTLGLQTTIRNNVTQDGGVNPAFGPGAPGGPPGGGPPGVPPSAAGPRGGPQAPGGPGEPYTPPPVGPGTPEAPGGPGGYPYPGAPGTPGAQQPQGPAQNQGEVDISLSDKVVTVTAKLNWNDEKYASEVLNRVVRTTSQVKGRMAVLSGATDWQNLAVTLAKFQRDKRPLPRGTLARDVNTSRYNLSYPPEQRVSFMADLLPFLGKAGLRTRIQDKKHPWYAKENLPAAETWVPEFLVPYYPQDSWRALHPLADGPLGGTNYVALSGLGLDSARYDPADPELAKKVGITGYEWGSKPEEVTDGLSNTAYMIQVPPGRSRPWIAGGGATVVGVDDQAANPVADFVHRRPDGQRGTYVLMGDGSVRWVKEGTPAALFKGMVTRAGGESLADLDAQAPRQKPTRNLETELKAGGGPATAPGGKPAVDVEELKKFQGRWKVTTFKAKKLTQKVPPELLKQISIEVTIEGTQVTEKVTTPKGTQEMPSGEIVRLDPTTNPKQLDSKGSDGKVGFEVYEFDASGRRLKLLGVEPGKPRPTKLAVPDDNSDEVYLEMEKIDK